MAGNEQLGVKILFYLKFLGGLYFVGAVSARQDVVVVLIVLMRSLKNLKRMTGDMRNPWTHHIRVKQFNTEFYRSDLYYKSATQRLI